MKRIFKIVSGLLLIGLAIFMIGPRPDTTDTITFNSEDVGEDLDQYLEESEQNVLNLKNGAEKEIIWFDPVAKSKTSLSVVYIHGFSATKHETRPVADNVAKELGANLYFARMTGHGRDGAGLAEATVQDWANDFAEAITIGERLGEKVLVIATSNGATITTWGLNNETLARNIAAVAYISPNFELQGISTTLANISWAETILPLIGGETRSWEPSNEMHGKWWTSSYPSRAIFPMTSMLRLIKQIDKSGINTPALFIYSPKDQVIVPQEVEKVADEWGGKVRVEKIQNPGNAYAHVIAGDIMSPNNTEPVTRMIIDWFAENTR